MKRIHLNNAAMAASIALALAAAGCTLEVQGPQPTAVVEEDPQPPDQEVVVADPPPPIVYEEAPPPPEVGLVWIGPEYVQIGGGYRLRHGHWDHPPSGHNRWVASRYRHGSHGYVYVAGRWE